LLRKGKKSVNVPEKRKNDAANDRKRRSQHSKEGGAAPFKRPEKTGIHVGTGTTWRRKCRKDLLFGKMDCITAIAGKKAEKGSPTIDNGTQYRGSRRG